LLLTSYQWVINEYLINSCIVPEITYNSGFELTIGIFSVSMKILLTNDDGIYAPGLAAMEHALRQLGEVYVVAPSKEQSGVSHSITFLTPLMLKKVFVDNRHWGWTVDGSPADCVKLGISEIVPDRPDLVVSGINGGLNAGINIIYSGTVAAAVEGVFYGITSIAVSLEYDENEPFHQAAEWAVDVIRKILEKKDREPRLYNINIPLSALRQNRAETRIVGMDVAQYWESFERRTDPLGRFYYWLTGRPDSRQPKPVKPVEMTDMTALIQGFIAVTPLNYDMTHQSQLAIMEQWDLNPENKKAGGDKPARTGPTIRTTMKN
jgi:5'-nucleotidase